MSHTYDVVIVGGGMVGATLAIGLHRSTSYKVALIEAYPFKSQQQPSYDDRSIALAYGSRLLYESLGLWQAFGQYSTPIKDIHVSDKGHLGVTRLSATEEGLEALGYVLENRLIGKILMDYLPVDDDLFDFYCPARLESIENTEEFAVLKLDGVEKNLNTRLVIAADGAQSKVRKLSGIQSSVTDYEQTALITNITSQLPHKNVAYERFTESGPLALLPMSNVNGKSRCSLVWTMAPDEAQSMLNLDDHKFLSNLQTCFGFRLGQLLEVGQRVSYPLSLIQSQSKISERLVLIGNAAQSLHPVAGQGFNLALRDIASLIKHLQLCNGKQEDPGSESVLYQYADERLSDQKRVVGLTDKLVKIFSNNINPIAHSRAAGLLMLDLLPVLRSSIAKQSMGLLSGSLLVNATKNN